MSERVYPRGHGESFRGVIPHSVEVGLSLWARGIPLYPMVALYPMGSIPVGTGNPKLCGAHRNTTAVYPRGHGESKETE